jgi:selenocysteine-specific elongation factor
MPADFVEAGQRAALNLQGLNRDAIQRGDELAAPEALTPSRLLDAQVRCLPSVRQPIKNNARFRLEIGTRELLVRCVCLSEAAIAPGSSGYVQLRAREPLVAMHGQRFILREENASRTVGGGVVLRVGRRRLSARMSDELAGLGVLHEGSATQRLAEVLRNRPFESLSDDQLSLCAGIPRSEVPELLGELEREGVLVTLEGIDRPVSKAFLNGLLERTVRWMRTYHAAHPDEPGCSVDTVTGGIERRSARGVGKELLQRLVAEGQVKVLGRYACLKEFAPALSAQDEKVLAAMLAALREAAFQPPSPAELATRLAATLPRVEKLLKVAAATGQIARIDGQIHLHADREGELRAIVRRLFESGGPFTVSAMREAVGTSRKYAVPLAEYLDRIGFTRRSGDTRTVIASEP